MLNAIVLATAAFFALQPQLGPGATRPPLHAVQAMRSAPIEATTFKAGAVEILSPWSRATPPGQRIAAAYMVLRNTGDTPVSLTAAATPVAGSVVFHDMAVKNGYMQMVPHEGAIEIPPKGEVELKPGGLHLMLVGVQKGLRVGKVYDLSLTFSNGETTTVKSVVWDVGLVRTKKE
jgi:copper(I)-binding protein